MTDKRVFDYLYEQLQNNPLDRAFGHKVAAKWQYLSTRETVDLVNRASIGLLQMGLRPGDKVATIVYKTQWEWVVLDFALAQIGVLNVPMYPTISSREYAYILNESEAQYCIVGEGDLYNKVDEIKAQTPSLREIITLFDHPTARHWNVLLAPVQSDQSEVERIKATIRPDDTATLIYTSGTTGNPKGVMLTHRNIAFNVEAARQIFPILPGESGLSFLPVSHVFERVAVYAYTALGVTLSFTTPDNLGGEDGDLKAIQPHIFTTVPRLLEKVYERIYNKGLELKGIKRALFFWALGLTEDWEFDKPYTGLQAFKWRIAHKLIFSKWREALGGRVKGIITGASACPVRIMRTFNAAGVPVREGYGMTEAAPAVTFSRFTPHGAQLGTVGLLLDNLEVRIEESPDYQPGEGEIFVKSDGVMEGYYKQPDKTAEVIRYFGTERWLATGDVGTLVTGSVGQKFLKITDRKKELLKTSGGKYVAPAPIESMFKEHRLVEQVMVVGENLKFVSALIIPAVEGLRDWSQRNGITWTNLQEMIQHPRIQQRYQMLVDRVNPHFGHAEQIKKFMLLSTSWDAVKTDGTESELTPTMKLKRRVIMQKYHDQIEEMYE